VAGWEGKGGVYRVELGTFLMMDFDGVYSTYEMGFINWIYWCVHNYILGQSVCPSGESISLVVHITFYNISHPRLSALGL